MAGAPAGGCWAARRRTASAVGLLLALALVLAGGPTAASAPSRSTGAVSPSPVPPITVLLKADGDLAAVAEAIARHGGRVEQHLSSLGTLVARVPAKAVPSLRLVDGVQWVEQDRSGRLLDSGASGAARRPPTSLAQVNRAVGADHLHRWGYDGSGVGVALLDSGTAPVEGLGDVVHGPDLSGETGAPGVAHLDTFGHGTHMAGIIGSPTGVAPGARLISLKLADEDGTTDVSQVLAAIDWVVRHRDDPGLDIRVLNLAFGTDGTQAAAVDPLTHAVEVAWRHGIVVVVAGGNDGASRVGLNNPAYDPFVVAVGANDLRGTSRVGDDTVPDFSAVSDERPVDVLAPGVSIASLRNPGSTADRTAPSATVGDRWFRGTGTSQSAAVVSGAAALLLDRRPGLTPDEVKALLTAEADPLADAPRRAQGAGRLDNDGAALAAVPADATQTHAPATGTGSLGAARGTHPTVAPTPTWEGRSWTGRSWTGRSWTGRSWTGRSWTGRSWTGRSWTGRSWTGRSWTGRSWTGRSWTGRSWTGRSWTGRSWTGRSWTGRSWTGRSWTGRSWTGRSWTGRSWTGRSWTGRSWTGRSWTGRSWTGRSWTAVAWE